MKKISLICVLMLFLFSNIAFGDAISIPDYIDFPGTDILISTVWVFIFPIILVLIFLYIVNKKISSRIVKIIIYIVTILLTVALVLFVIPHYLYEYGEYINDISQYYPPQSISEMNHNKLFEQYIGRDRSSHVVKGLISVVKANNSNEKAVRSYGEIKVVDIEDKDILELDIETLIVRMQKYDIEIIDYYKIGTIKTIRIKKHIDEKNSGEKLVCNIYKFKW